MNNMVKDIYLISKMSYRCNKDIKEYCILHDSMLGGYSVQQYDNVKDWRIGTIGIIRIQDIIRVLSK